MIFVLIPASFSEICGYHVCSMALDDPWSSATRKNTHLLFHPVSPEFAVARYTDPAILINQ
jgi:hypothetical protein